MAVDKAAIRLCTVETDNDTANTLLMNVFSAELLISFIKYRVIHKSVKHVRKLADATVE